MGEIDNESLTYIKRLEEQNQTLSQNIDLIYEEKNQRDSVYLIQKQISDTMHVLSEEREHYLKLWRENDELKITKSKLDRKIGDLTGLCHPESSD